MKNPENVIKYTTKHLVILILGVALAFFFVWISDSSGWLSSSILSLQEREIMTNLHRDAAYKKSTTDLEVFIGAKLQSENQIFISFFHSPSEIQILTDQITSPYTFEVINQTNSSLLLKVTGFQNGNIDEGVIILPFQGDAKEITVEYVSPSQNSSQNVALGAL
ncbi:hypothetical protein AGMMS50249_2690 [candidate division SR1 bacterium]|nr:hypothetical protein AGMMS50249_2690 [candidate division SR1 bacterium]